MLGKYISWVFSALIFLSCREPQPEKNVTNFNIITIQPLGDIPAEQLLFVYDRLKSFYLSVELKKPIPLPSTAYLSERSRYRADSLINHLNRITGNHLTIGLTNKDISTTKGNITDWGVMGLGFCPGKACIASSFRLSKKDKYMQLFKVAIHELGHTQGLPHCVKKTCFMRDAEGGNPINEEKEFCITCRKQLEKQGWNFNNNRLQL